MNPIPARRSLRRRETPVVRRLERVLRGASQLLGRRLAPLALTPDGACELAHEELLGGVAAPPLEPAHQLGDQEHGLAPRLAVEPVRLRRAALGERVARPRTGALEQAVAGGALRG